MCQSCLVESVCSSDNVAPSAKPPRRRRKNHRASRGANQHAPGSGGSQLPPRTQKFASGEENWSPQGSSTLPENDWASASAADADAHDDDDPVENGRQVPRN